MFDQSKSKSNQVYGEYLRDCGEDRKEESWKNSCRCAPLSWLVSLFPILSWLPNYNARRDLTYDIVAGLTVCVMQIPQGMAYALLANVQPVVGIYMAFFPIIVYTLMGTSKHISMGTFAVTCLMTGKTVTTILAKYSSSAGEHPHLNDTSLGGNAPYFVEDDPKYTPEQIATVISLVTGLFQVLMGTFRLGFLCVLLSSDLVSGFTTGAAIHVLTSQVKNLLGLSIPRRNGIFKIPLTYYDILTHITDSNTTALIFSLVTLTFLILYNEVIKPQVSKSISIPIPIELFAIVGGTLVSRYWITSEEYGIPIVSHIPTGFPSPSVPPLELIRDVLIDSFVLAIVAYTISISMAKIFAAKHDYEVSANQELLANGSANLVGSFFSCAPISCSLSRSVIQEQVGGRTQIASLVNCVIMVFVLLWIGPFFETLPHCVLSSMIIVALKGMLMQLLVVPEAFKESLLNALVWLGTFMATVFLDIEYGLGLGVLLSLFNLIWRSNRPHIQLMAVHQDSDGSVLVDNLSPKAKRITGVKIVKFTGTLNFATIEYFAKKLQLLVPPQSSISRAFPPPARRGIINSSIVEEDEESADPVFQKSTSREEIFKSYDASFSLGEWEEVAWLLLDLSSTSAIDPESTKALISLNKLYLRKDINILFVGCAPPLIQVMEKSSFLKVVGMDHFHPSIYSALQFLHKGLVTRRRSSAGSPSSIITSGESIIVEEEEVDQDTHENYHPAVSYFRRVSTTSLK